MARSLRDFTVQCSLDPNSTTPIRVVMPDSGRLIEIYGIRNAALSAQAVLTINGSLGSLVGGLVLTNGGAAGTINLQEYVVDAPGEVNNFFTKGTEFRVTSGGGPTAGVTVQIMAVFRQQ